MQKLIFGCGYLGERVARRWLGENADVYVVTRSAKRAANLHAKGCQAIVADVTRPNSLKELPSADTVLFAVGFDRSASVSIADVYAGGIQNVLAALPPTVKRVIYISTTGVYGSAGGGWVDENTVPNPQRDGGKASLAAEECLDSHPVAKNSVVLRLAGLYGPGRIPYLAKLRAGEPIDAPSKGWLNLIHVDDAADIVLAVDSWQGSCELGPHLFNVTDGHPVVRGSYYGEVARRIGAPLPQFAKPDPASPAAARASADKRVGNEKLMQALKLQLTYPSYREGLASILSDTSDLSDCS